MTHSTNSVLKVAIVHDYIKEYGGAERVLESLHSVFPDAPVYTSVYLPKYLGPHRKRFVNWNIKTSWADVLPFRAKLISPIRLIAPTLFRSLDLSKFDVVIVSATGAYSPNTITTRSYKDSKKKAVHIYYVHTPPRYLYGYETARNWKKNILTRVLGTLTIHWLRMVDFRSSQNVDHFIANSEETKKRIKKFYKKDATVIYPPVDISSKYQVVSIKGENTKYRMHNTGYYLAGGRIARAKHPELIIKAFLQNGLPLKVFGKSFGGYESELKSKIKNKISKIDFLGEVTDEEKDRLMVGAKAFVFASQDEDFGIIPVEAMMAGTPVIAHRSGGVLETVIDGKTGLFFDELSSESINKAVKRFETLRQAQGKFDSDEIKQHAQKFSKARFEKEIKEFVESEMK